VELHAVDFSLDKKRTDLKLLPVPVPDNAPESDTTPESNSTPESNATSESNSTSESNGQAKSQNADREVHGLLCQRLAGLRRPRRSLWRRFLAFFKR